LFFADLADLRRKVFVKFVLDRRKGLSLCLPGVLRVGRAGIPPAKGEKNTFPLHPPTPGKPLRLASAFCVNLRDLRNCFPQIARIYAEPGGKNTINATFLLQASAGKALLRKASAGKVRISREPSA